MANEYLKKVGKDVLARFNELKEKEEQILAITSYNPGIIHQYKIRLTSTIKKVSNFNLYPPSSM